MKSDLLYICHVIESTDLIASYISDISLSKFTEDRMRYDAVVRNLQILAESAQKISQKTKDLYQNIPWKDISGFRNILVHDYLEGIDPSIVWQAATVDLPKLRAVFAEMKEKIE